METRKGTRKPKEMEASGERQPKAWRAKRCERNKIKILLRSIDELSNNCPLIRSGTVS